MWWSQRVDDEKTILWHHAISHLGGRNARRATCNDSSGICCLGDVVEELTLKAEVFWCRLLDVGSPTKDISQFTVNLDPDECLWRHCVARTNHACSHFLEI